MEILEQNNPRVSFLAETIRQGMPELALMFLIKKEAKVELKLISFANRY